MYEWVVDGLSSLFEPITGQKHSGWPGLNVGGEIASQRQDSNARPTKRNYQSVHVSENISQSEPVAIKRRRKDIISFVKKTVAGVAGLLRLRNALSPASEEHRRYTASQGPVGLMGIDELHTSWMSSSDWKMEKPTVGGQRERGGLGLLQGASTPLQGASTPLRKHIGLVLGPGNPDKGRDGDKPQRCSLQLLPSRPTQGVRVGTGPPSSDLPTPNRSHRQCLAVEEALKESDKEHYRRLLEMVSDKYSKSQPLPFTRTKPQGETFTQDGHRMAILGRTYESVTPKTGPLRANPSVYMWRDASSAKQTRDMRGELYLSKPLSAAVDTQPASNATKQPELDLSAEVAARLNLVDRETPTHTDTLNSTEELPRFSKEMAVEVSRALSQRDPNLVLSSAFKLCITQRDLASLQEGSWLNDEVINFYLSLVMTRSSSAGQGLKVYSFSTFFFPKLHGGGHTAVKRWTKAVDLFQYDIILVPLHLGIHWSLAVINFNSRTVRSYDSMGQRHDDICSLLLLYLREEHKARKDQDLDECKWTVDSLRASEIPQQKNGSDCGVFACKYADYIAQGWPLTFRQCHMPLFRKLMIWEILNQRLL
ncbi:sentrin-specific protease 2-like isoform X2 [Salvelinus fontinalis]|uniref:sentrin-specific protease 2-like isoform X2 n=1 Tax=Salvelinus fontinalis TaxID=8038 RepID=UPI002485867E|nr:sentrin-specific protease 2-like isoform X2 [Salvelinus fontinalis]